jgi:hypothetical protein
VLDELEVVRVNRVVVALADGGVLVSVLSVSLWVVDDAV